MKSQLSIVRQSRARYERYYRKELPRETFYRDPAVPTNVERAVVSEPCWMCGQARGLCRHRVLA